MNPLIGAKLGHLHTLAFMRTPMIGGPIKTLYTIPL